MPSVHLLLCAQVILWAVSNAAIRYKHKQMHCRNNLTQRNIMCHS
eukprot:COSAG05_NODE_2289_length_3270_cov_1.558814_1_plen_45_part_00